MLIKRVKIKKLRSIKDLELTVDESLTVLVGANESGKSNILLAINKFFKFGEEISEPEKYQLESDQPTTIEVEFSLDTNDQEIKDLFENANIQKIVIKRVENNYELLEPPVSSENQPTETNVKSENNPDDEPEPVSSPSPPPPEEILQEIEQKLPKVIYFPSFEKNDYLTGHNIDLATLDNPATPEARSVLDFLSIGEITIAQLNEPDLDRRIKILSRGAAKIGKTINEAWNQEDVKFRIFSDGRYLVIQVRDGKNYDPVDDTTWIWTCPEDRSSGFRWFLTFYCKFLARTEGGLNGAILLIDDPGLALHATAQHDFIKLMSQIIGNNNQVFISTHMPYLLDMVELKNIRLIEKREQLGSKVHEDWKRLKNWELPEPLSSIGYNLRGHVLKKCNLIVEGESDAILLSGISDLFSKLGLNFIKEPSLAIISAHGVGSAVPYGLLAKSEGLKVLLLLDADQEGRDAKQSATSKKLSAKVISESIKGNTGRITIEDFLPYRKYITCVNQTHSYIANWTDISLQEIKNQTPRNTYHPIIKKIQNTKSVDVRKELAAQKFVSEMNQEDFVNQDGSLTQEGQLWNDLFELINSQIS